jgi:SAM-dependent methyltransferase
MESAVHEFVTDPRRPDLGGNMRGGDPASWTPALWEQLIQYFGVSTVLDVGAGEGHAVKWFVEHGCDAFGIDGLEANVQHSALLWRHDLLVGPYIWPHILSVDLVWCCEVVEHIDPAKVDNVLDTLANGRVVAMTHALPGQGGYHHVNLQPPQYWIERMVARGYRQSEEPWWRGYAEKHSYFFRTGLVFVKE